MFSLQLKIYEENIMRKSNADLLALLFARDIAKTATSANSSSVNDMNRHSADAIADFVETLSKRFESLDDNISLPMIFNAYKNQSDK